MPGYELRQIAEKRAKPKDPITLKEFSDLYIDDRSQDYANKFRTSIKVIMNYITAQIECFRPLRHFLKM